MSIFKYRGLSVGKLFSEKKLCSSKYFVTHIVFFLIHVAFCLFSADEIQTIMTVRQIYTRAEGQLRDNSEQFTAVLYAMVTQFDLEIQGMVLSKRW